MRPEVRLCVRDGSTRPDCRVHEPRGESIKATHSVLILHRDVGFLGGVEAYFAKLGDKFSIPVEHFIMGRRPGERSVLRWPVRIVRDYVAFVRALRSGQHDIVQLNPPFELTSFVREAGFSLLARLCGVKTIVFWRGADDRFVSHFERRLARALFHALYGHAAAFIVLSDREAERLRAWGCRQDIHREVTLADDDALRDFDVERSLENRLASTEWRLLFAGRIVREKGIFEALETAALLYREGPFRLVVAGDGKDLEAAKRFARNRGISNVTFTGTLTGAEKCATFESAHLTLLPTRHYEGLSNTIVESMAVGLPIVSRPIGGIVDFFRDGEHGFLCAGTQPEELATRILDLYRDRSLYGAISRANHRHARAHFLASQGVARLEAIYARVRLGNALPPATQRHPERVDLCVVRHGFFPFDARLRRQVRMLRSRGYSVHVLCLRQPGEPMHDEFEGARIRRLPMTHKRVHRLRYLTEYALSFVTFGVALAGDFVRYRYRCVQVPTLPDFLVFAALGPRLGGARVLLDVREPFPELWRSRFGDRWSPVLWVITRIEQAAIRFAHQVLTVTPALRDRLIERGAEAAKIRVMSNMCDGEIVLVLARHARHTGRQDRLLLMTHGLIEERYGHALVIRAVARLRDRIPGLRYQIHGFGTYKPALEALVQAEDCRDRVSFSDTCTMERLVERLQAIDVGIVPMLRSTYSELVDTNKMYEFIALQKPVIAARLQPLVANFDDTCILYFTPGDVDDLAARILEIHGDPARGKRFADNAARRLQEIGWRTHERVYLETIAALTRKPVPAPIEGTVQSAMAGEKS